VLTHSQTSRSVSVRCIIAAPRHRYTSFLQPLAVYRWQLPCDMSMSPCHWQSVVIAWHVSHTCQCHHVTDDLQPLIDMSMLQCHRWSTVTIRVSLRRWLSIATNVTDDLRPPHDMLVSPTFYRWQSLVSLRTPMNQLCDNWIFIDQLLESVKKETCQCTWNLMTT